MKLEFAKRRQVKIKLGLQGSSGSGKTKSALLLAKGLVKDWSSIAVIDTENMSSSLYSDLGNYKVLNMSSPYSPERYIQALNTCLASTVEVVIIDSLSMEWEYILEAHSKLTGNSYTNWALFTPRHRKLIQAILEADVHIICTLRTKQDYVLNNVNGKYVPEKVGMKAITRDGVDYEMTLMFELDIKHNATSTKDRTGLFMSRPQFIISQETGHSILNWCNEGEPNEIDYSELIKACKSTMELTELYNNSPLGIQQHFLEEFNLRKNQIKSFNPIN